MTDTLINARSLKIIDERLAVLWGSRGDPQDAALRLRQLSEVHARIGSEINRINILAASVTTISADVATINSALPSISTNVSTLSTALAALALRVTAIEALYMLTAYPSTDLGHSGVLIQP